MATKTIKLDMPFKKLLSIVDHLQPKEKLALKKRLEKTIERRSRKHQSFFGSWAESGNEDKILEEIYSSRLTPSVHE